MRYGLFPTNIRVTMKKIEFEKIKKSGEYKILQKKLPLVKLDKFDNSSSLTKSMLQYLTWKNLAQGLYVEERNDWKKPKTKEQQKWKINDFQGL